MTGTPLSRFTRLKESDVRFGPRALSERPSHAALIADAVTTWSYAEAGFGNILADLLGPESATAVSMYSTANGYQIQQNLLASALKAKAGPQVNEMFPAISAFVRPSYKIRNHFAHGNWGICDAEKDCVLLAKPELFWKRRSETHIRGAGDQDPLSILTECNVLPLDRDKITVYFLHELQLMVEKVYESYRAILIFGALVISERIHPGRYARIYTQLSSEPGIQERLARLRGRETELLPQQPHQTTDVY